MEIRRKDIMRVILVIVYLFLTVSGLILMKKGGNAGKISISAGEFNFSISLVSCLGFVCYICSFLLYTRIVMMFENLSYITPICTGVSQIMVIVASWLILKEQLTGLTIGGVALVVAGIILMNLKVQ